MIFSFIRYTQPGWQFNVSPVDDISYSSCLFHPKYLPISNNELQEDTAYETVAARNADLGYRAWNRGELIWANREIENKIIAEGKPSLKDEYIFVCKYWGKMWAIFALMRRLITLHNPISEIRAYMGASASKTINPYSNPVKREGYDSYDSSLLKAQPFVAVIIPTLSRYVYLKDVLEDLEKQDYKNFEVIIVDQSDPFQSDFYKKFDLRLNVINQKEKLLWTARNNAVKATKAEYLLFFDDDSRVNADWISQHVKCLDYFKCDISAGVSLAKVGMKTSESYSYFRWADQFDSGNALVKRDVFTKIGLFDEQYNKLRMGDGEFGLRAYLNGYKSISNPLASRIHLKVSDGGLREIGSWDGYRSKKWLSPKPVPSVVFLYKKYYPKNLYRGMMILGLMLSNVHYKNKGNKNMLVVSLALAIIKSPILLIQFLKAEKIANRMLKKNDGIKLLEA